MDKGTQEEVRPVYSYAQKAERVKAFVISKHYISSYASAKNILDNHIIKKPLREISTYVSGEHVLDSVIKYFDYLVAVVSGTHAVSQDILKEATEQLFTFLLFMRNEIQWDKDPFATPSIEGRLDIISEQISELFRHLEARDKGLTDVVEKLHLLMKTYGPTLEKAREYFTDKVRKIPGEPKE
jgi:hypothetical protein